MFVHLSAWGRNELEKLGDSVTLLESAHFIARTADKRPWVINLSMGRHGEQHDDSLPVVQGLDALLRSAPGGCIVQSCGNYFDRGIHASGQLHPAEERILVWETKEGDVTPNELEVWYSGRDVFDVEIRSPDGSISARAALGEHASLTADGRKIGTLYHRAYEPNTLDNHIEIIVYAGGPAGSWELILVGKDVTDGRFHCWIERDAVCPPCQSRFRPEDAVSSFTTGTICNGRRTIAVGAYNPHSPGRELARFSSSGPSRDGRLIPSCIAPGVSIAGARSAPRDQRADAPLRTKMSGTSFAAPHVTGTVALMFEAAKRPLRIEETHNLLLANTEHVTGSEEILNRVGSGYLDIAKAVEAARNIASGGPLFRPYLPGKMGEAAMNDENGISSKKFDGSRDGQSLEKEADAEESSLGEEISPADLLPETGSLKLRVGERTRFILEQAVGVDRTWWHYVEGPSGVVEVSIGGLRGLSNVRGSTSRRGYSLVTIRAWAPGQVRVHLIYGQPWIRNRPPEREEVLEIYVQNADDGISLGLASPAVGPLLSRPGEMEAARRNDRFAAAPPFQLQVPIGGGAPALALPVGGSGTPFALTVPLGGTTPTAPPPVVSQTGSPVPPQPFTPQPPATEPAAEPALGMEPEPAFSGNDQDGEPSGMDVAQGQPPESSLARQRDAANFVDLADQVVAERTAARAPLEILSPMEVLYHALPRAGIAEALISPSSGRRLSAAEVFDAFAYRGREALRGRLEQDFEVVALPRAALNGKQRAGDLLFRRGEGGLGHISVIASPELRNYEGLLSEGLIPEVIGPGNYAQVVETGVRPHRLSDAFARRVEDDAGRLPYNQLVLRLREDQPAVPKIQAHIDPASLVVVVKKTYTSPARRAVTLRADAGFVGTGTFERSKKAVRFFTAAVGGTELAFDPKEQHVFTDKELTAKDGVKLFAEGVTASTALDDVVLTLKLTPTPDPAGAPAPVGPPATAKMTAVELKLDIFMSRTAVGKEPAPLPQPPATPPAAPTDKWFEGRFVHIQDPGNHHGRALMIVRVQPSAFAGDLVLRQVAVTGNNVTGLDTKVKAFDKDKERPVAGEAAKGNPHEFNAGTIPKEGLRFWVEGSTVSAVLRDTGFQLGIKNLENDGDRVRMTVVRFSNLQADIPSTPPHTPRLANGPVARHILTRGTGAALNPADFDDDFNFAVPANAPLVLLENAVRAAGPIIMSVVIAPAGVPISWDVQRDTRPMPNGDHKDIIKLSPNPKPKLTKQVANPLRANLLTDAVGSFYVRPFVDCNGRDDFDHNIDRQPFINMKLVLVRVILHQDNSTAPSANFRVERIGGAGGIVGSIQVPLGACPSIRDHRFRREFDSEKAAIKSRTFHCGYRSEHR
jgi:hypothetical protein